MIKNLLSIALVTATLAGNAQQLTNSGFETWTTATPSTPTSWGTIDGAIASSQFGPLIGATSFVTKSSSPYAGTYAATLTTQNIAGFGTFPAALVYGNMALVGTSSFKITGTPYTFSPSSVSYYAKGTVIAGDSAPTIVFLTKWNTSVTPNKRDTIAGGIDYLNSSLTSTYTLRTFPLYYQLFGVTPDTINYIVSTSVITSGSAALGTSITVDAVALAGNVAGITSNHAVQATSVAYPNPAVNQITLATTSEKAKFANVYDLTGRLMNKFEMINKQVNIDLNSFNAGMYIYVITDESNHNITTSKFSVSK